MENFWTYVTSKRDYYYWFEHKWRSSTVLALMLKRRHSPEASFTGLETGRRQTMVVGDWDWTKADWDMRRITKGHTLYHGSVHDIHKHDWVDGRCSICDMREGDYLLARGALKVKFGPEALEVLS